MVGHTKEELETRGARVENYILCDICGRYWAKNIYKKHRNVRQPAHEITIIPPAMESFLKFLAEAYVEQFAEEHTVTRPDGTKIQPNFVLPSEWEEIMKQEKTAFTVGEAVERFGLSRGAVIADLEKQRETFVVEIPTPSRG